MLASLSFHEKIVREHEYSYTRYRRMEIHNNHFSSSHFSVVELYRIALGSLEYDHHHQYQRFVPNRNIMKNTSVRIRLLMMVYRNGQNCMHSICRRLNHSATSLSSRK